MGYLRLRSNALIPLLNEVLYLFVINLLHSKQVLLYSFICISEIWQNYKFSKLRQCPVGTICTVMMDLPRRNLIFFKGPASPTWNFSPSASFPSPAAYLCSLYPLSLPLPASNKKRKNGLEKKEAKKKTKNVSSSHSKSNSNHSRKKSTEKKKRDRSEVSLEIDIKGKQRKGSTTISDFTEKELEDAFLNPTSTILSPSTSHSTSNSNSSSKVEVEGEVGAGVEVEEEMKEGDEMMSVDGEKEKEKEKEKANFNSYQYWGKEECSYIDPNSLENLD